MKRYCAWLLAITAAVSFVGPARAGFVTADFQEVLDLPDYSSAGPRVLQRLGVNVTTTAAPQLTAAHTISNPSGWNNVLNVGLDPVTGVLSITGDGLNLYQTISVTLSNLMFDIPGQEVVGFAAISTGAVTTPDFGSSIPSITTSFTATSVTVTYSVPLGAGDFFAINPATDTFQITLAQGPATTATPVPAGVLVFGTGAIGMFAIRRRRVG